VGKVPVILAIGRKEVEEGTVTLRRLGEAQTRVLPLADVVADLAAEAVPPDLRPAS
jgi:threonyl-tRNA synthetase